MRKRRLIALEPRVLLDAAGVVSGVDAYAQAAQSAENFQQDSQQDKQEHNAGAFRCSSVNPVSDIHAAVPLS
ncbi:MAG: LEPR-XLL domain-containing protein [Pseudomonadales bacterium]|nr:LEPR-XLL domain-containing protein [Pseudomonadales bacterium]MCP5343913.1 LEPR-XLL domain-containing protein [Pseudomonadales bacterium]